MFLTNITEEIKIKAEVRNGWCNPAYKRVNKVFAKSLLSLPRIALKEKIHMDRFNPVMFNSSVYQHSFLFVQKQTVPIHLPIGEGGLPLDQPLSVAVNIEYTLDESKFVDLHTGEPTLIIDPSYWKPKPMDPVTTSTPKKKQERNKSKIVPPHVWLPSITRSTCIGSNEDKMVDLLGK